MPLYEYHCRTCNETFEVRQKFSDEPITVHQTCGSPVQRLLSAPGLQFKGSGWYITDYARAGNSAKSGEGSSPGSEKKSETKSETKVESKPAAPASKSE